MLCSSVFKWQQFISTNSLNSYSAFITLNHVYKESNIYNSKIGGIISRNYTASHLLSIKNIDR